MKLKRRKFKILGEAKPLDDIHTIKCTDLIKHTKRLVKKHGKNVWLRFDAGYNNINVHVIRPTRGRGVVLTIDDEKVFVAKPDY